MGFINIDDFAMPLEDFPFSTTQKLESALGTGSFELKAYAANVLIGNIPAKKVSEYVGDEFMLCGFHGKKVKFKDSGREGMFTVMFGTDRNNGNCCAYCSASDKIYESVMKILYIYGDVSNWKLGIAVRIRMNEVEGGKAYCLEIV
jgi:hypothetical protein